MQEQADFVVDPMEGNRLMDVSTLTHFLANFLASLMDASWVKMVIEFLLLADTDRIIES